MRDTAAQFPHLYPFQGRLSFHVNWWSSLPHLLCPCRNSSACRDPLLLEELRKGAGTEGAAAAVGLEANKLTYILSYTGTTEYKCFYKRQEKKRKHNTEYLLQNFFAKLFFPNKIYCREIAFCLCSGINKY